MKVTLSDMDEERLTELIMSMIGSTADYAAVGVIVDKLERAGTKAQSSTETPYVERQEKLKLLALWEMRDRGDLIMLLRGERRLGRVDRAALDEG